MKKRVLIIILAFVMTFVYMPVLGIGSIVLAASNPYPGNMNTNCTYAAWQKTKDILGIELPKWGNAWQWYSAAQSAGYSVGTTPKANSIVVFKQASWNTNYGHVAFVSDYNASTGKIYKMEGNYNQNGTKVYHEGWAPAWESDMYGYIYLSSGPAIIGSEMTSGYSRTIPDGDYIIVNSKNTKNIDSIFYFLDIAGSDREAKDSTNVQLWWYEADTVPDCDVWTLNYSNGFYTIKQKGTNKALDLAAGNQERGANVQVYSSLNNSPQRWAISEVWEGNTCTGYQIQSKRSGFYLDVENAGTDRGTNVKVWDRNSSSAQIWEFIPYKPTQPVSSGRYILVSSLEPTLTLDVAGNTANVANSTNVQVWHDNTDSQYNSFDVTRLANGYYTFTHAASGRSIDVQGGYGVECTYSEANVSLYDKHGGLNQQWALTRQNDGYMIRSRVSGFALDVTDGKTANGTNVRQLRYNGSKAQTWKFVPAEYTVRYEANGGTGAPKAQTKYYKKNINISSDAPTRNNYTFTGWNTNADGTGKTYTAGDEYTLDQNLTLYAQWKSNAPAENKTITPGTSVSIGGNTYTVLPGTTGTVAFTKGNNAKTVTVPDSVRIGGKVYTVTQVNAGAFRGKNVRTVVIGKNVKKIRKNAFRGTAVTKLIVKTRKFTRTSVKNSLRGSKVKTVKVRVGSKKLNKKYVKKYRKIFTKKNAGKKVSVYR